MNNLDRNAIEEVRLFFFFSINKHQYISKGKRREAYREYTRRQKPHNKGPKKTTKNPPALNWKLSTPGNL